MSARMSARDTIAALAHLGFPPPKPGTLRQWKHLGWLSAGRGYDPAEVAVIYQAHDIRPRAA